MHMPDIILNANTSQGELNSKFNERALYRRILLQKQSEHKRRHQASEIKDVKMSPKTSAYLHGVSVSTNIAPALTSTAQIEGVASKPSNITITNRIVGTPSFWRQKNSIKRHSLLNMPQDSDYIKNTDEEHPEDESKMNLEEIKLKDILSPKPIHHNE